MVLEPTNWQATAERPARREIGRGAGEPWACGPAGASRAPEGQASHRSSCTPPPSRLGDLGQASQSAQALVSLLGEVKNVSPSDGMEKIQ